MKLTKISSSIRVAFPLGGTCPNCGKFIEDLLAEMVSDADKRTENYQDLIWQLPNSPAITCPFCSGSVEWGENYKLIKSEKIPLRYSKNKFDLRCEGQNPTDWLKENRNMSGALIDYNFSE